MTDTKEQTLPVAVEPSASADAPATNGAAGRTASRAAASTSSKGRGGSLSTMLLPELQQVASGLGISTTKKKKSDLVAAIQAARSASNGAAPPAPADAPPAAQRPARRERPARTQTDSGSAPTADAEAAAPTQTPTDGDQRTRSAREGNQPEQQRDGERRQQPDRSRNQNQQDGGRQDGGRQGGNQQDGGRQGGPNRQNQNDRQNQNAQQNRQTQTQVTNQQRNNIDDDDDDFDGGRRRGRRYRDRRGRNRQGSAGGGGQAGNDVEPTVTEDDVLVPVAGVVDCIEDKNAWFVRVEGFFASPDDVYVANSFVRRFGLRRGDAVTGAVRQPKDGERREKYNPLVRLDTINGRSPDEAKNRVEFTRLTPLYPQERLRLETEPHILTTRVIDLVMPIGKGQRALIVSPPKAGKTMVLQALANAIATNNPECHLMVVLVDERPEEVTDMQRSVRGEVIASTFDRKPIDHTTVAELSIERAKRLVEMGHDVVVLLDSITRLGRAYNLAAPASGRILSGGVDSTALYPPKRFLGAARNIENGGSLTIIATALVETGSAGDTVIFEEFKGTGNAELKLDRKIADKRVFPAVDVDQSSTRKEEILLSPDELAVTIKLRRVLHALDSQQALDLLLDRLRKTHTNMEFLMQIAKTTPGQD
ncbi:MAG: transcription termination factor Rho [Pseudonocardiales bacterium]|nr:transcription termination factor Rho [Pseudonocardiales bacterium]